MTKPTPKKAGRPSKKNQKLLDSICEKISAGSSLRAICKSKAMPTTSTVCKWLSEDSRFSEQYAHARKAQADTLFDEILSIADEFDAGNESPVTVQRDKLRIDTRKWMAGKLRPKKYGEKQMLEHTGADGGAIEIKKAEDMSDEQLAAIAASGSAGTT